MSDPRIIGMILVKNGERWISKTLKSISDICTEVVVLDGGSTDNTLDICRSFGKVIINETSMPRDEVRERNLLMQIARKQNPDYVLDLDSDEVLQPNAKKILFKELQTYPETTVFEFQSLEIWDKPNMYRCDGFWGDNWKKRMLKLENQPENLLIKNTIFPFNMHCEHIPENAIGRDRPVRSRVKIIHYGAYDSITREQKYQNYNKIDPNNNILDGYKGLLEFPDKFSGRYGLEFRYLPKGMFDESIPSSVN